MAYRKGWYNESTRHSLSARGVRTGSKNPVWDSMKASFGSLGSVSGKSAVAVGEVPVATMEQVAKILNEMRIPASRDFTQLKKPLKKPEVRVWVHPQEGGDDFYYKFSSVEEAQRFAKTEPGAEKTPLVGFMGYEMQVPGYMKLSKALNSSGGFLVAKGMKSAEYQVGKSNRAWDKRYKALKPGKRNGYYEHRANRSDKNPRLRL